MVLAFVVAVDTLTTLTIGDDISLGGVGGTDNGNGISSGLRTVEGVLLGRANSEGEGRGNLLLLVKAIVSNGDGGKEANE